MSILKFLFAPLLLAASVSAAHAQPLAYEMTLIPRLDYPNGINNLGQIAGNGFNANGVIQAAVWTPGATPSLRFLGVPYDFSAAINDAGQVTGQHQFAPDQWRAAIYFKDAIQDISPPGGIPSVGRAINASGQVAGALGIGLGQSHAFLYANGQMTDLGAFSGDHSDAFGINDAGQVVGTSLVAGVGGSPNTWRAFEYSGGSLHALDIGGDFSIARDINNAGQVVGEWVPSGAGSAHAFVYRDGIVRDLGNLGGDSTYALSINDRGDIVGYGATGAGDTLHGFIYLDGKMIDLNTLAVTFDGWQIARASAINEERQIASLACRYNFGYQCMPALLSPVPEPAAPLLWSGGLLLLASRWILRQSRSGSTTTPLAKAHPQCARSQFGPTPVSATSGTFSVATPAINSGSFTRTSSSSASGTSSTSSSCTCMIMRVPSFSFSIQACTAIMASLIKSAAVPCIGALIAARSAPARRGPFGELISGSHRRRPNTVST